MDRMEFKFAPQGMDAKTGEFAGYGAIFGNVDSHGDVIESGAFAQSLGEWEKRGALPSMKMMHGTNANPFTGSDLPVGKWKTMKEDDRGLFVEGKLSGMETDRGRYNYALMQDGALSSLSIGYKAVKAVRGSTPEIKRRLQTLKLVEVSLVPEGSNDQSLITDLKSVLGGGSMPPLPDFDELLREAGYSKTQRTVIAGKGYLHLLRCETGSATDDEARQFFAALGAHLPS